MNYFQPKYKNESAYLQIAIRHYSDRPPSFEKSPTGGRAAGPAHDACSRPCTTFGRTTDHPFRTWSTMWPEFGKGPPHNRWTVRNLKTFCPVWAPETWMDRWILIKMLVSHNMQLSYLSARVKSGHKLVSAEKRILAPIRLNFSRNSSACPLIRTSLESLNKMTRSLKFLCFFNSSLSHSSFSPNPRHFWWKPSTLNGNPLTLAERMNRR